MTTHTEQPTPDRQPSCLVVLCKRPALGHSKQRLAEQIGQEAALQIAERLLDCAIEDLQQWPGVRVLSPDHAEHLHWARTLCPQADVLAQAEGNLGQRLNDLDQRLRSLGHQRLLFIGSDCPALRPDDYQRVCAQLDNTDTVLLNARDGGVVLMASNRPWPDLSQLPWSTGQLGSALADGCRAAGHSVALAGELFDIDHQADLCLLEGCLASETRPARLALRDTLIRTGNAVHA